MHIIGIEDTSDCDPVLAKAIQGLTWDEAHEKCRTDPLYGLGRMRTFDPQRKPEHAALLRKLMHAFNAPRYCELAPCKRAGECMHPKVRCFWEHFDLMQRRVFPAMRRKLKEMQAPGEYVPDEDDAAQARAVSNASKSKR
jgi:hypothetical protein